MKDLLNSIVCGDALSLLSAMPASSVDLCVTSPPYNLGMKKKTVSRWNNAALREGYDNHQDNMPEGEYIAWQRSILMEIMRVLKDTGALFYNHKGRVKNGLWQDRAEIVQGFPVRQIIIWQRHGGINFNPGYFLPTYESIYLIAKPEFVLAPKANALGDVWEIGQERHNPHPAPFPVELPRRCISACRGQVVLDPFMGSGTTAVAAIELGWQYIGFDNSEKYCDMARRRLEIVATTAA
jgi:modification methylase